MLCNLVVLLLTLGSELLCNPCSNQTVWNDVVSAEEDQGEGCE